MAIGTPSYAVFRSFISLSSFWCYQRNSCEILMQSRLLVLEVAYFCYPKCVWLVSVTSIPSFWREVDNPRKWFIAVVFYSSACTIIPSSSFAVQLVPWC